MKKPNFFILGAPRCGTTSLATWLAGHPQIFMSAEKEPHFFNTDHQRYLTSQRRYELLFAAAGPHHRAVGEASVWYLYSEAAVRNILDYSPDAKFIAMLRNPVEMASSLHDELLFNGQEDVADFAAAWRLQPARRGGASLPRLAWEPKYLQYGDACSLGAQLQRVYRAAPPAAVKIVVFDDLAADAGGVYRAVEEFLGVEDDGRSDFAAQNQAKARRSRLLPYLARIAKDTKQRLGIERGFGMWRHIDAWNIAERPRARLEPQFRARLREHFRADIGLLQELIGRDLGHWLE